MQNPAIWSTYGQQPTLQSAGCIALTAAFADVVLVKLGIAHCEFVDIFAAQSDDDKKNVGRAMILGQAVRLSRLFLSGRLTTFARPIGDGAVVAIPPDHWDVDDASMRFATGALNLTHWADASAPPTHIVFLDSNQSNSWFVTERSEGPLTDREIDAIEYTQLQAKRGHAMQQAAVGQTPQLPGSSTTQIENPSSFARGLIKLDEVRRLMALSRSTIYKKISERNFPKQLNVGSSARWYRHEVMDWVDHHAAERSTSMQ
jgi:predicted DNA-binding transcriptional regulator AlpA